MSLRAVLAGALIALASAAHAQAQAQTHAQTPAQVTPKDGEDDTAIVPCPLISSPIRFCGSLPEFVLTPQDDNAIVTSYFATPEGIQAIVIVEDLGLNDDLTIPGLQDAALQILSDTTGEPVEAIPILGRTSLIVAGLPRPNIVYRGMLDGQSIIYSNTMILMDATIAQLVTLEVGVTTLSPRHTDLHARFLANVQVIP